MTSVGTGSFVSWDGGCLMISRASAVTPMHSHYATQIAFGSEPGIRFRPSDQEPWGEFEGVVIASRQPHTMDATRVALNAVLFVEPETREGRALAERFELSGINALSAAEVEESRRVLFDAWHDDRSTSTLIACGRAVVRAITGGVEPSVVSDERILRATAYIRGHLDAPLTLEAVAAEACLSPSRFRHLFVEQTGMALRPYILWRRFVRVLELMTDGASVSSAAHAAGFADAAHLTRTCRRTFGFPPSAMTFAGALPPGPSGAGVPTLRPDAERARSAR